MSVSKINTQVEAKKIRGTFGYIVARNFPAWTKGAKNQLRQQLRVICGFGRLMKKRVKVKDVANQCMVSRTTVRRWIKEGKLPAIRLPSGHYRISFRDFRRFLEKYDIPVKE